MIARFVPVLLAGMLAASAVGADVLRGVVRDTRGRPVANADFDVFTLDGRKLQADDKTNSEGAYAILLDAGRYDVVCQPRVSSGLAPRIIRRVFVSGTTRLDWTVAPAVLAIGRVRGPRNAAVAGAGIDFDRIDDGTRQPVLNDKTDSLGRFAVTIEAGAYRVTVNPPSALDLAPARLAVVQLPTDALTFTLSGAVHLSGTIRGPALETVAGVRLSFDRVDTGERVPVSGSRSASNGTFRTGVAAGEYSILVRPPRGVRLIAKRIGPVDLESDRTQNITLSSGVLLSGRVVDRWGGPLEGASWDVWDRVTGAIVPTVDAATDLDGQFLFTVPVGRYRLVLHPPPSSGLDSLVLSDVAAARDTTIDANYVVSEPGPAPSVDVRPLQNPTRRSARVRLLVRESGPVRVEVFDVSGRRVRTLADGWMTVGGFDLAWDGNHDDGSRSHTSVYFVRVSQGAQRAVTRLILLPE